MKKILYLFILGIGFTSCSVDSIDSSENLLTADAKFKANAANKTTLDIPTLTLVSSTENTLTLRVTAGSTGAPHGIWIFGSDEKSNFNVGGDEEWKELVCEWNYNTQGNDPSNALGANESRDFVIENICDLLLVCGKTYYFKVEARPGSTAFKSGVAAEPSSFSTSACVSACAYGKGYWKNHGPENPGNQENAYPEGGVIIAGESYELFELQAILQEKGNIGENRKLMQHLITALLNIYNGVDGSSIEDALADADAILSGNMTYSVTVKDALEAFVEENACDDADDYETEE